MYSVIGSFDRRDDDSRSYLDPISELRTRVPFTPALRWSRSAERGTLSATDAVPISEIHPNFRF